jgi:hypothetical protein
MADVACAFVWGEVFEEPADGCPEFLDSAFSGVAQEAFEFRERQLDRIKVWAVGRQVKKACAGGFDCLTHAAHLVRAQVVEHDDIAGLEFPDEELLGVGEEGGTVDCPVQHQRGDEAGCAQTGQEGGGLPVPVRDGADQALAPRCAAARPGHVGRGPGFIEEDQALWIERGERRRPFPARIGDIVTPLLLGLQVLFLSVRPSRVTTFHITE